MKRISLIIIASVALAFVACGSKQISTRVLCYNVHNCVGLDGELSCERIAKIINDADADAVAIQELDSMTTRHPGHDMLSELAELTGMHPTFAPSIDYKGGKYGIGMLTKEKPISYRRVPLPCRSEPRSLLIVELEDYYYCCTHLSLHEEDRVTSAGIIVEELSKLDKPVMIAGDFNARPNSEFMKIMGEHFHVFKKTDGEGFTFRADKPHAEIDYICLYTDKGAKAEVTSHTVINAPVESDHCPIVADVVITK
ncbi:MAG: endonuclease/exonuclease/phosphatase family protein [Alistipes sp.]|nr:endonuclease/exonuclease/phosphatase family protein [Alistipes sp.]